MRCSVESTVDHRSVAVAPLSLFAQECSSLLCSNCNQRCIRQRTDRLLLGAVAADRLALGSEQQQQQRCTGSARRRPGEQVTSLRAYELSALPIVARSAAADCSCVALSLLVPLLSLGLAGWGVYPRVELWSPDRCIGPEPLQKLRMHFPRLGICNCIRYVKCSAALLAGCGYLG